MVHRSLLEGLRAFDGDRFRWLDEAAASGPLTALRFGPARVFVLTDAEAARTMLVAESAAWRRPAAAVVPMRVGVGENLFTQADKTWSLLQPEVAPTFRRKALDGRLSGIDGIIEEEVGAIPLDCRVDIELVMNVIALRVAAWVLFGEQLDRSRAEEIAAHEREVVHWVGLRLGKVEGSVPLALGAGAREMKRHRAALRAYGDEVIDRARRTGPADDVLGALLRACPGGKPLSQRELRGHVLGMFLAGNETTAAGLSWALVHAAESPQSWAALRDDSGRAAAFVDESLRLSPPVWGFPRAPAQRGCSITVARVTARVRRDQVVTIYLRGINRDPKLWAEPDRFDPSRHDAPTKEQQRSLLPFGLGPRGCIGQHLAMAEMLAVVPALARRGDFVIEGPVEPDPRFALRVRGGLHGRLMPVTTPAR
jgi:cytochrome P450